MKKALVNRDYCVACGCCLKVCKRGAITVENGVCAVVDSKKCVGCSLCAKECPASVITVEEVIENE